MAEQLGIVLPERRDYETVAGLVLGELKRLPQTGEVVETLGDASRSSTWTGGGSTRSSPRS